MTREKIAVIGGNILGRWIGGVGRLCVELARLLRGKRYAVSLLTNRPKIVDEFPQDLEWWFLPGLIYNPSSFPRLVSALRKIKPDIIHVHAQLGATPLAALLRKTLGKPVVFTPVNLEPRMASPSYRLERFVPTKMKMLSSGFLDHVVCQSLYVQRFFIKQGLSPEKVSFAAYGLRREYFKPISESPPFEKSTVLSWTSGTREKGFDLLLSAIPRVLKEIPDIQLVLAHLDVEDDMQNWLSSHFSKEGEGKIVVAKRVGLSQNYLISDGSQAFELQLSNLIASSDVAVLPYRTNPQEPPISLVETVALGAPTVTTELGANAELFGRHSNSLIPPDDPRKLASAIENAILHEKEQRMWSNQLREFTLKRYDQEVAVSTVSRVYEKVMEGR